MCTFDKFDYCVTRAKASNSTILFVRGALNVQI